MPACAAAFVVSQQEVANRPEGSGRAGAAGRID
jgi:hypothetical protein